MPVAGWSSLESPRPWCGLRPMHALPVFALTAAASLLGAADPRPLMAALAPVPEVAFALQSAALGAALGSVVALRAKRRYDDADTWAITTTWATLGLALGLLIVCVSAVA